MPISKLLSNLKSRLDDPSFPYVTAWKGKYPDKKAVGYFPVYVPVEIIHAAGMLPVMIAGAAGNVRRDDADGFIQSFVCSVGRSTLELVLDGYLEYIDAMVFPSVCEISRGLSGIIYRHWDEKPILYVNFPENPESRYAEEFLISELERFRNELSIISGVEITDDAILNAFRDYNERGELLNKLDTFRCEYPECFKASEFFIIRQMGMTVTPSDHIEILKEVIDKLDISNCRHDVKLRMIMTGAFCERLPVKLLEVIESTGIAIVGDDFLLGQSWWKEPLPTEGDPLKILANHYLHHAIPNPFINKPASERRQSVENEIRNRNAQGVMISSAKFCHPAMHDFKWLTEMCEEHGWLYFRVEYEEIQRVFESIRVHLESLLEARDRLPGAGTDMNSGGAR